MYLTKFHSLTSSPDLTTVYALSIDLLSASSLVLVIVFFGCAAGLSIYNYPLVWLW